MRHGPSERAHRTHGAAEVDPQVAHDRLAVCLELCQQGHFGCCHHALCTLVPASSSHEHRAHAYVSQMSELIGGLQACLGAGATGAADADVSRAPAAAAIHSWAGTVATYLAPAEVAAPTVDASSKPTSLPPQYDNRLRSVAR